MPERLIARFFTSSLLASLVCLLAASSVFAQSAAFAYQGRLTDGGSPANSSYDMQFKLYDTADVGTGTQQGATITNPTVQVTNGTFAVALDFGATVFDGSPRFLEIAIRPAGSADPYTVLSPRQPVTSTPYSVRSLNAETANVLSAACVGCVTSSQIASVDGTQITGSIPVESVPMGSDNYIQNAVVAARRRGIKGMVAQDGGFDLTGDGILGGNLTVGGQVGIGTATPEPGINLDVIGNARMSLANGTVQFGSPNTETGMTVVTPQIRADLRLNNSALKLVAGPAGFIPPATNGIVIDSAGNVGVGTETPQAGIKLDIVGNTRMSLANGTMNFGSPNAETGMTIIGSNRADVRFDGTTFKLLAGPGTGPPGSTNGIAINTAGNVGMGTTSPNTRLAVRGGDFWTSNFWQGALSLSNASAIGWEANSSGQRFGIGQSTGGLFFFRTISGFGSTLTPAIVDAVITDNGDIQQPLDRNGLVKAMAYITYDGTQIPTLRNCYNGVTNNTSSDCGFIYGPVNFGVGLSGTRINFGFEVRNRFIVITGIQLGTGSVWGFPNATTVDIQGVENGFYIVIY